MIERLQPGAYNRTLPRYATDGPSSLQIVDLLTHEGPKVLIGTTWYQLGAIDDCQVDTRQIDEIASFHARRYRDRPYKPPVSRPKR